MDTDQNGTITYNYGTYTVTQGQGNYSASGKADSGSYSADGTITITNSNSKTGSPKPGSTLTNIQAETDLLLGAAGTGFLSTVDDTTNGSPSSPQYTLVGNGTCGAPPSAGTRPATYVHAGMTFSPNTPLKVAASTQDGEPSSRIDNLGNYYIMPIRGVPAGVDLFYFDLRSNSPGFDPNMRVPVYRGLVDSPFSTNGQNQLSAGALGGGDIDLALGFGPPSIAPQLGQAAESVPVMAYASLTAANLTVGTSFDRGQTFRFNPLGNIVGGVPINDREWMGFIGQNRVYLVYRNFAQGIAFIQQSQDAGFTYGPALPAGGIQFPQTGALDVDQTTGVVFVSSNDGHVAVGDPANNPAPLNTSQDAPLNYTVRTAVPAGVNTANIFFPIRVASVNHTVYGVYSDGKNIWLVSSADKGLTWTPPVRVNDTSDPREATNLMPWLATGPTPGSVGVSWYGTDSAANDDTARWRVFFAQSFNADSAAPSFRVAEASDHSIHAANISLKGLPLLGTGPNRNLIDYFQVNFDPQGAAVIGYTDDHNDFRGHTYVARQISGPSINGSNLPAVQEGASLPTQPFVAPGTTGNPIPQPMQPGPNGEQVTDFAQDIDYGLLGVAPANNPLDILSIKYQSQDSDTGPVITATMTVSDLTTAPPSSTWQMYFAANAPEIGIIGVPGNQYSKGLPDQGDMFFIQAATDAAGRATFSWGTTARNVDGSTTDTVRGLADRGAFNKSVNQISVRVSVSKLNAYLAGLSGNHPVLDFGSTLCGLRGKTSQVSAQGRNAVLDITRGGTEFTVAH